MASTHIERLTPLDHLMPRTYVGVVFSFRTTESTTTISARLQDGLASLLKQLPWLSGRVFPTTRAREGGEVPSLEIRWSDDDAVPTIQDKGVIDASYDSAAESAMPPSAVPADMMPVPAMVDEATFSSGIPIFGASVFQFADKQGVGLFVSIHHNVVDAAGFAQVVKLWVQNLSGTEPNGEKLGLDRFTRLSEALSEDLPAVSSQSTAEIFAAHPEHSSAPPAFPTEFSPATSKVFTIPIGRINAIKEQLEGLVSTPPTTNTIVSALVWSAVTRARAQRKSDLQGQTSRLAMAVNGRRRLGEGFSTSENPYFGNNILYSLAKTETENLNTSSDLDFVKKLAKVCDTIAESQSPNKINSRHIAEIYTLAEKMDDYQMIFPGWDLFSSRDFTLTSWADLGLYELDFGAGLEKPEFVRAPHSEADGVGLVMPRKRSEDEVLEVIVMLRKDDMEVLESNGI
ncbi:Hypothetical protein NCS54_01013800 [Fusarium falciforme]|uniref:Hypothetical protein n=1 Tax=Fusarium falciforme TaxID=195108 RepID=UPI0023017DE8|nr:Hypothetical protein NCS54_01013800 [Fusarium falciforme]WAO92623.1 Hypothetical protein NCS54_01013800 [Fusarium falciforme]